MLRCPASAGLTATRRPLRLVALVLVSLAGCMPCTRETPPNLVLIVGDDIGFRDFGFMGAPYVRTPHLDGLAAEGTVFTHGFSPASVCRPSLRSFLTGLHPYQSRLRIRSLGLPAYGDNLPPSGTLPGLLGQHGYVSFQAGKLWLSTFEAVGFSYGMKLPGDPGLTGGEGIRVARETMAPPLEFIDAHADEPFFLWFAPMLPHHPHDAPERYRQPYLELGISERAIDYYANMARLDDAVGQLLTHLERRGLRERTLVVYTSDNGWGLDPHLERRSPMGFGGRRGKLTMAEQGFRTPMILSWPGHIPSGVVRPELVAGVDLVPTLLDFAGVPIPSVLPGHSLKQVLLDGASWPRQRVIGSMSLLRGNLREKAEGGDPDAAEEAAYYVRDERWRYVWYVDSRRDQLFDMQADPEQRFNLAEKHPEITARMRGEIEAWKQQMAQAVEG